MSVKTWCVIGLITFALAGCSPSEPVEEQAFVGTVVEPGVFVDGRLIPCQEVALAFSFGGQIDEILVQEGDHVRADEPLMRLSGAASVEAQLAEFEAARLEAQLALETLQNAAPVERAAAWQRVLDSRLLITGAQEALDQFDQDRYDDDLEDADVRIAEAEADLEQAEDTLRDYDDLDPENATYRRYEDAVEDSEEELHQAEQEREELVIAFEQLELDLERALALHDQAMADYSALRSGPDADQERLLLSRVDAYSVRINALEEQLDDFTLRASFAGNVAAVTLDEGEMASPGQPLVWVADLSCWYIETEDLTEHDVAGISVGDEIKAVPDAFPDLTLAGTVESIDSMPTLYLGDVTYTSRILLDSVPEELRWGMSVVIEFTE
ncbi:MAG: efflux RND transporter periplasmic adaptor subunit [Anaerolineales bacterium]|nr:efflux RND transporter periplasmic adaptor subunit [Anaerolineales bacterium]